MKRLILAVPAIFLAAAAFAATDTGTIAHIDSAKDAVTLTDGNTFTLAEGTEAESLKVGEKVEITYGKKSGKMVASKVVPLAQ